ncbi:DedA family protein [Ruicaihuangia caeni]|uniref:DedA family protein n=1 Tax=Ruicaihuangia caeni TaxID=3042517 RepID=A0AAW6TE76_9MICO|nr:DedA family protein [Klugiella sp. YN-L-19]MDI2099720.1 DedA family protein [Klugiella sp. YN-L-19]
MPWLLANTDPTPGGLTAFVLDLTAALGEAGVAILVFLETVFPPIPSEIILSLAGYLANTGEMNLWLAVIAATMGSVAGALALYWIGRLYGEERAIRTLAMLPLVYRDDFEKAAAWFHRHGRSAVFFGRFIPIVRSLISLPAGAARMPLPQFALYTAAGSGLWNLALIGFGWLLGTQHHLVEEYMQYIDYVVYAVIAGLVVALVIRWALRRRRDRVSGPSADR